MQLLSNQIGDVINVIDGKEDIENAVKMKVLIRPSENRAKGTPEDSTQIFITFYDEHSRVGQYSTISTISTTNKGSTHLFERYTTKNGDLSKIRSLFKLHSWNSDNYDPKPFIDYQAAIWYPRGMNYDEMGVMIRDHKYRQSGIQLLRFDNDMVEMMVVLFGRTFAMRFKLGMSVDGEMQAVEYFNLCDVEYPCIFDTYHREMNAAYMSRLNTLYKQTYENPKYVGCWIDHHDFLQWVMSCGGMNRLMSLSKGERLALVEETVHVPQEQEL